MAKVKEKDIYTISIDSKEYPEKLKKIKQAPKILHVIGHLPDPKKKSVAIVGARAASDYGITLAKTIAKTLSENDVQVISGMAMGIDTAGHLGALEVEVPTFAILGCGVDICYPNYNYPVYERIIECGGGIISEYDNGTPPVPPLFPARNRIISGLSDVVIVVEGKRASGSLITADFALEQGRTIFACPGRVGDALSIGTNNLIKQGAYILTSVDDVLSHLGLVCDGILPKKTVDIEKLDYNEKLVYGVLSESAIHLDEIVDRTMLPVVKVMNVLMSLELCGVAEMTMQNYYRKTSGL